MNDKSLVVGPVCACLMFAGSLLAQTNVLTQHNDIGRTGQNLTETVLTPANVSATNSFGKLYSANVDGRALAQPLYVSNVTIGGANHSVVYVATEHDSVYALDANAKGAVLWKASLLDQAHGAAAGAIPDPQSDTGCGDIDAAEYGITGTPIINYTNATTGTLYVVSITYEGTYPVQRLHALDITSGAEQFGGPVAISASVAGSGTGSVNGAVSFDAKWENQRPGLLLLNGTVYMGWGSHCDSGPWHGWVMGYNATTLKQTFAFLSTPNGSEGGVWTSGAGLAADNDGPNGTPRIFEATGNGSFDSNSDWSESVLNLNISGGTPQVTDSFTPNTQSTLTNGDIDLGSAGTLILPDLSSSTYPYPHLAIQLSKAGIMYLLNRENLGGYNASADQVLQEQTFGTYQYGLWGIPAYFNDSIYFWGANSNLQQWSLTVPTSGKPSLSLVSQGSYTEPGTSGGYYVGTFLGASPSISANETSNGIVWVDDWVRDQGNPIQYLYAYNAANVTTPLWTSLQNPARDGAGGSQKFAVPTVADGKVFLASDSQLQVYGLLPANFASYNLSAFQPMVSVVPGSSASTQITVTPVGSFTGAVTLTASGLPGGVTATFAPASSTAGSLLTLTASSSAAVTTSPSTVTITGTSGTMSQSITISVAVSNTAGPVAVNLASVAHVYGLFLNNTTPTNGGLDSESWAYSANLLGPSVSALGLPFYFGTPGSADAVSGGTVPLPAASYESVNLAGAAVNGSQANQSFVVTYTDGSTSTFTQSVSDWCGPQNYPGETLALAMTYRISPSSGTSPLACNVYAYSFATTAGKTAASITLPSNRNVVMLAITLSQSAPVTPKSQTITFNPIPSQIVGGTLTLSATASSGLPVSFSIVQNGNCGISGSVVTFLNVGNCGVNANQAGNSAYNAAPQVGQIIVVNNPTAQTITFAAPASQSAGTTVALSATASSGLSVTFTSSTTTVCTVSATSATLLAAGTCTIIASQAGNNIYSAASPVTRSFTVTAASAPKSQTITFNPIPSQIVGGTLTVSATASSGLPVSFVVVPNGNCNISGNTVTFLNVGNYGVVTTQAGNSAYGAAPAVGQIIVVNNPTAQTITFAAPASQSAGTTVALSATASSGLSVTFTSSTTSVCTVSASTATLLAAGTCTIVASQAGNNIYSAASPVTRSFTVTAASAPKSQTITFNPIPSQVVGGTLTVSATASSGLPVSFVIVPNGNCSISGSVVTFLNVGNCGVIATQSGNSVYSAAPAVGQIIVVNNN